MATRVTLKSLFVITALVGTFFGIGCSFEAFFVGSVLGMFPLILVLPLFGWGLGSLLGTRRSAVIWGAAGMIIALITLIDVYSVARKHFQTIDGQVPVARPKK